MKVLLTGASGFIGRQVLRALLRSDCEVHVASRRPSDSTSPAVAHPCNLLEPGAAETLIAAVRPTHLVHVAWQVEPGKFWSSPTNLDWLAASERLMEAFARHGGQRFVGIGSSAEYAEDAPMPVAEDAPIRPTSLYGTAKARLHEAAERMASRGAFAMAWARVFLLIGEAEPAGRLAPYVVTQLLRGEPALCSHGSQIRDFMDVRDVGHAIAALALSDVVGPVNIGTGNPVTVSEILTRLGELTGRGDLLRLGALPPRDHDPPVLLADVGRLHQEVGFQPRFTLPETLSHVVAWWRADMEQSQHEART